MNKVYSRIESIVGSVITVKADNVAYGELAEIETRFGKSLAEVNKIEGDVVSLQVFAGGRGISTGDHIKFLGHQMEVSFSDDLLGRIFNGSAQPRDNGPALTDSLVTIGGSDNAARNARSDASTCVRRAAMRLMCASRAKHCMWAEVTPNDCNEGMAEVMWPKLPHPGASR